MFAIYQVKLILQPWVAYVSSDVESKRRKPTVPVKSVPVVLPQRIVPHNIMSHIFGPSDPNPNTNPNPKTNPNPNPHEVVCCRAGRHWGQIVGLQCSGARCSGAGRRPPHKIAEKCFKKFVKKIEQKIIILHTRNKNVYNINKQNFLPTTKLCIAQESRSEG